MKIYKELVNIEHIEMHIRCIISSSSSNQENYITVHPHWHDELEILYVLKGTAFQQVNDKTFTISNGDLVIIRGQDIHATYTLQPDDTDILVLQYQPSILSVLGPSISADLDRFSNHTALPYPIKPTEPLGKELIKLVLQIQEAYKEKGVASELLVLSYCATLIGLTVKNFVVDIGDSRYSDKMKNPLQKLFTYIDLHFNESISLSDAARVTNFSVPHFSRLFKQAVGMSFIDYLNHYRINKSLEYLKKEMTITEIAESSGFNSINSFIRSFKKIMLHSPEKFRKMHSP